MHTPRQTDTRNPLGLLNRILTLLILGASLTAFGQAPVISAFSRNGELVCTNLAPGTEATVEWASSVNGPWTNTWAGLDAVTVDANGMIRVSVPMFYRVRGFTNNNSEPSSMVLIPAGSFTMGNCMDPAEGWVDELPLHTLYVSAFYMDKYTVTKALWDEVYQWAVVNEYNVGTIGSGRSPNHPVHSVNWYDVVKWCNARSEKEGRVPVYYADAAHTTVYRTGEINVQNDWVKWNAGGYRLPTEAEWEKAARGGASGRRFPWSDSDTIQHSRANYYSSSSYAYDTSSTFGFHPTFATGGPISPTTDYTSPVGYFAPNGYGLYDMAGNVWEWCWDRWSDTYYSSSPSTDPRGPSSGSLRVYRGGGWISFPPGCRAAERNFGGGRGGTPV